MSPGQTFRATCEHCGTIFFAPLKNATACPKCARKWGLRPHRAGTKEEGAARGSPASSYSGLPAPTDEERAVAAMSPEPVAGDRKPESERSPHAAVAKPSPPKPPATELTDESRAVIRREFAALRAAGATERSINQRLARQLGIRRDRVAEVTRELVAAESRPVLGPEQQAAVLAAYRSYVERGERPSGGRRAAIARDLGLSRAAVERTVHEFTAAAAARAITDRATRFRIEQAYWRLLRESRRPLPELWPLIAAEAGVAPWQAAAWIDLIHEDPQRLATAEPVTPEQAAAIQAAYEAYLAAPGPPEASLHATIAAQVGVTPRQVHRALLEYRRAERERLRPADTEEWS